MAPNYRGHGQRGGSSNKIPWIKICDCEDSDRKSQLIGFWGTWPFWSLFLAPPDPFIENLASSLTFSGVFVPMVNSVVIFGASEMNTPHINPKMRLGIHRGSHLPHLHHLPSRASETYFWVEFCLRGSQGYV